MGFFDNDREMYIPLTIDTAEARRTNYFLSNKKMVEMVVALLPYIFMMYPMLQGGVRWLPMLVVTVVYIILYVYFIRFRILEENRLREMVRELDKNKISGIDHFWGINKIGHRGTDDGVIHYERAKKTERGLVVAFDRGSTVGVEAGNFTRFRETKMEFMRELSLQKFNFQWYEIPKRLETPESLVNYFNLMTEMENDDFRKLMKLQIDINILFTTDAEQRYVDYVVIRNTNFRTLRRFKAVVQGIIDSTLATNGYIVNPRILGKGEVEGFFEDVLLVDSLDSNSIRKGVDPRPFEDFATVQRIIRQDGRDLPIEFLDTFDLTDYSRGKSIEDILEQESKKVEYQKNSIERRRKAELERVRVDRNRDRISDMDYHKLQEEINEKYDKELEELYEGIEKEREKAKGKYTEEVEEGLQDENKVEDEEVEVDVPIQVNVREDMLGSFEEEEDMSDLSLEEILRRKQEEKNNKK